MAELIFDAIKTGLDGLPWMHNRGNLIAAWEILSESEVYILYVSLKRPVRFHTGSFG